MKISKQSLWSRILIAVCAFLSCVLFALGLALPKSVFAEGEEGQKQFELTEVQLTKKDGFVFTSSLTAEQKIDLVEVTLIFTEKLAESGDTETDEGGEEVVPETVEEKLTLSRTDSVYTRNAEGSERVNSVEFKVTPDLITATVNLKDGYTPAAEIAGGTLSVTYEERKVNGITAEYNGSNIYTMASAPNVNDFDVYWAYNDGTKGTKLTNDLYQFSTVNFFPDKLLGKGDVFDKDIEIVLNDKGAGMSEAGGNRYSATVSVKVEFDDPVDVARRLKGQLNPHPARSKKLNLDGLEVDITFESGFDSQTYSAPLQAFDYSAFQIVYKTADNTPSDELTTAVTYCEITFTYPNTTFTATGRFPIKVTPISIAAPEFPEKNFVNYFNGVNIDITWGDYSESYDEGTPPSIKPAATSNGGTASDYTETIEANSYNLAFHKPGISYTVTFTLYDESGKKGGDFQWQSPASSAAEKTDEYTITYTVQVEKGKWDLTLSDDFSWIYNGTEKKGSVKGNLQGSATETGVTFDFDSNQPSESDAKKYYLEYSTDGKDGTWSTDVPEDAGKYFVRAVSHETEFYNSTNSDPVTLTITPKQITAQDVLKNPTYDRTTYTTDNAFKDANQISGVKNGDKLGLSVKNKDGSPFSATYWQDGGYAVNLVLGNTNYVFKAVTGEWDTVADLSDFRESEATFTINKREIKYAVTQNGFYYGAAQATVATLDSKDKDFVNEPTIAYKKGGTAYTPATQDMSKWDAGNYTVTYTPVAKNPAEADSLDLKDTAVDFTIKKAQIGSISISDDNSKSYTGSPQSFDFTGWNVGIVAGGLGKYSDLSVVRSRTVTGKRLGTIDLSSFTGSTIELTEADEYTVKVKILYSDNFEWTNGEVNAEKSVTWTINKAAVVKASAPETVLTYNHNEQTLDLANWNSALMKVTAIAGKTFINAPITDGYSGIGDSGSMKLTKAGTYTFTVTLKDSNNYEWDGAEGESITVNFTLKQATAALDQDADETDFTDGTKQFFVLPLAKSVADGSALPKEKILFVFTVTDEKGTVIVAENANVLTTEIKASGTYTYKITGLSGDEADNYVLPEGGLTFTYIVRSQALAIPTFAVNPTLEYNGKDQSVLQFISNYGTENYGERIVVTVDGTVGNTVKNVKGEEEAYTVTVKPATNYKWKVNEGDNHTENEEFSFEVTVTRFGLTVTWDSKTLSSVYGSAPDPQYTLDKFGTDDVSINIGYKKGENSITLSENSAAGKYIVYATEVLNGADKNNYSLSGNSDTEYIIKKQAIAKPALSGKWEGTFGERTVSDVLISNLSASYDKLLDASVTGYRPAEWFGLTGSENNQALKNLDESTTRFDLATGQFHYVNAGYYTVTFTIEDSANYCWENAGTEEDFGNTEKYTHAWDNFAEIARKTLTAPAFGAYRAQEWEKFDGKGLLVDTTKIDANVTVRYGKLTDGSTNDNFGYQTANSTDPLGGKLSEFIGQYYVLIEVAESDVLNYVWGDSADLKNLSDFVVGRDTKTYKEGSVAICLHYAITSTQLPLKFDPIEYTFGDNGVNGDIQDLFSVLEKLLSQESKDALDSAKMAFTNEFIGLSNIKFIGSNGDTISDGDLENGLPWNRDENGYSLTFDIEFLGAVGANYQTYTVRDLLVTVNARALELEWTDLSKTYDGTETFATVKMINVPERPSKKSYDLPELKVVAHEGAVINAGDYTLYVTLPENEKNFTITGAKNNYQRAEGDRVTDSTDPVPFKINPYEFTATAKNVAGHVYGEALPSGVNAWTVSGDDEAKRPVGFDSDIAKIVLTVKRDNTAYAKPSVGNYTIALDWKNEEAGRNYHVNFVNTATFTVVAREIKVTLDGADSENKFSSVYYADSKNYNNTNYGFTASILKGTGDAIVSDDNPFELRSEVTQNSAVNADGYPITIKVTDGNYKVTVLEKTYTVSATAVDSGYVHVITPATLTDVRNVGSSSVKYDAQPHFYLSGEKGVKTVDNSTAVWYIGVVASDDADSAAVASWTEYSAVDALTDVTTKYFFVKITAGNHNDMVVSGEGGKPFCFKITNADITGVNHVASSSYPYDAKQHAYLSESKTATTLGNQTMTWWIFKADNADAVLPADAKWEEYSSTTHALTNAGKQYFFVKITANNHNDKVVSGEGGKPFCLTITKATLTLSVNMSIFFYEENPATAGYYMEGGAVTVAKLKDGYKNNIFSIDGWATDSTDAENFKNGTLQVTGSFKYASEYKKGDAVNTESGYAITFTTDSELSSLNYKFEFKNGTLKVNPLPVSVTLTQSADYNALFGTTGLSMPEATVTTAQPSTYAEGETINIKGLVYSPYVKVSTDALVEPDNDNAYTTNIVKRDANKKIVGYEINVAVTGDLTLAENGYTVRYYTINPAENRITTENYKLFVGSNSWRSGDGATDTTTAAWIYGKIADDGYRPNGVNKLTHVELLDRTNALTITLAFGDKTLQATTVTKDEIIDTKLTELFARVTAFNAGEYTVTFAMDASNNYNVFSEVWNFKVAKRTVTVKPNGVQVTYGEAVDGKYLLAENQYKYTNTDLDGYGETADDIKTILSFAFVTVENGAQSDYAQGWNVGTYALKAIVGGSFVDYYDSTDNYIFTFETGDFKVTKRNVTIEILDASNHYMLVGQYNGSGYPIETRAIYAAGYKGYKYGTGSLKFYNDVVPFTLKTAALSDSDKWTNDVGKYALYAIFKTEQDQNNYRITIVNDKYSSEVKEVPSADLALLVKSGEEQSVLGGVFTVEKAVAYAVRTGPYYLDENGKLEVAGKKYSLYSEAGSDISRYGNTYDGNAKYYFAIPDLDRQDLKDANLIPSFTPTYRLGTADATTDAPVNAGTYQVTFVPETGNNNFADIVVIGGDSSITINPRQLSVTPRLDGGNGVNNATYSGNPYTLTFTFNPVVGGELIRLNVTAKNATVVMPSADHKNILTVSATKAGTYEIKVELSGEGMGNYKLEDAGSDGVYAFTLTIDQAALYAIVLNSKIEYGTPLTNDQFTIVYSKNSNATVTDADLVAGNIDASKVTFTVGTSGDTYSGGNGTKGSATPAGKIFDVKINENTIESGSYSLVPVGGSLTVVKRTIRVNVYGVAAATKEKDFAHGVYTGESHGGGNGAFVADFEKHKALYLKALDSFGNSGVTVETLNVELSIPADATKAGEYEITPKNNDSNFEIKFLSNGSDFASTNRPMYRIDHKKLIAKVQGAGTAYETKGSTVNVVYGDEAEQSLFKVCFDGFVKNEASLFENKYNVVFVIGESGNTYTAYESQVGQTYGVKISGFTAGTTAFENYDVTLEGATLAITPRPITAKTTDRTFEPDKSNYHGGAWGLPLEAQITFTNVDSQDRLVKNATGGYTLSYNTEATTAPDRVGDYKVTVTLKTNSFGKYNYTFGADTNESKTASELNYSITRLQINLGWNETTVSEAGKVVQMKEFIKDVMRVVSFTVGEAPVSDYSAENNGLEIGVGGINGVYTITIELEEAAKKNYQLVEEITGSGMKPVDQRVISFTVDLEGNKVTKIEFVSMGSWTYGEDAVEPKAQVKLNSGAVIENAFIAFDYVPATGAPANENLNETKTDVDGWYDNTKWTATAVNAGKYLVRARYAGNVEYHAANAVYFYFEIEQAQLQKPSIEKPVDVYQETNKAGYIEGRIVNYNSSAMQVVSSGVQTTLTENGLTFYATGKGEYKIKIALTDTVNYIWSDKTDGDVELTWTIKAADGNELTWNKELYTVPYAESYELSANPTKYYYNLRTEYSYTVRAEGEEEPSETASWTIGFPVNAGKYWIRAVGRSPEGNYNTATIDRAFEITKVDLWVTPSGSMVYGDTFDPVSTTMNSYEINLADLKNGDTEQMLMRDIKNVRYSVTDAPQEGLWSVRSYGFSVSADATNYNIRSMTGTFEVTKARLYVTVGRDASSLYLQPLNLDGTTVTIRGEVDGDSRDDLIAELKTKLKFVRDGVAAGSSAGTYDVTLSVSELANYTLSVTDGVYTINKLPVKVEVDWGGYEYGVKDEFGNDKIVLPSVQRVMDGTRELTLTDAELKQFRFYYSGTASFTAPTSAGSHPVSVRIDDESNYTLATPVSGLLVIILTELDAELIEWETVYYNNGDVVHPAIVGIKDGAFSKELFEIEYVGEWNRAGVAYTIVLTLKDDKSAKWKTVEGAVRTLTYTIRRTPESQNGLVTDPDNPENPIQIKGWIYGDYSEDNLPFAMAQVGSVSYFEYCDTENGVYTTAVPANGDAGTYWVRAVVEGTSDYEKYTSAPVKFTISPKAIGAPSLITVSEGYARNDIYTGFEMQAAIEGYSSRLMYIRYDDGSMIVNQENIKVLATNAGSYRVTVSLIDGKNYVWAEGTSLDDSGNAVLTWTIARKKLAKPTHNDATMMVNGRELAYYPIGFDSSVMSITGNTSGYGGTFKATVSLIDTENYEWADGSTDGVVFEWSVVGADTVFTIVISILSVFAAGAAAAAIVEGVLFYKKKKEEKSKSQTDGKAKEGV